MYLCIRTWHWGSQANTHNSNAGLQMNDTFHFLLPSVHPITVIKEPFAEDLECTGRYPRNKTIILEFVEQSCSLVFLNS